MCTVGVISHIPTKTFYSHWMWAPPAIEALLKPLGLFFGPDQAAGREETPTARKRVGRVVRGARSVTAQWAVGPSSGIAASNDWSSIYSAPGGTSPNPGGFGQTRQQQHRWKHHGGSYELTLGFCLHQSMAFWALSCFSASGCKEGEPREPC